MSVCQVITLQIHTINFDPHIGLKHNVLQELVWKPDVAWRAARVRPPDSELNKLKRLLL